MTQIAFTIVNSKNDKLFLGRNQLRDIPLLFREPGYCIPFLDNYAQVASDWNIVEVSYEVKVSDPVNIEQVRANLKPPNNQNKETNE